MWRKKRNLLLVGLLCFLAAGLCQAQEAAAGANNAKNRRGGHFRMDMWGRGEEVVKLLEQLRKDNPEEFNRLEQLRQNDQEEFFREVRSKLPRRNEWSDKINQVEHECRKLAEEYRAAKTEKEKNKLLEELNKKLKESFDLVINDAMDRIERLQKRMQEMQQNEEEILAKRLQIFLSAEQRKPPTPRTKR